MTPHPGTRPQQGQALVLGMLLAGAATVAFLRYFATAQVVGAKSRQLHALDAAAYSGALIQARAMNMLSYLNTAQIGHQIAMAHLVTLGSWSAFGANQSNQAGIGNPPAHLVAMLFGAAHGQAYASARGAAGLAPLARTDGRLARAYAEHDHFVMGVFGHVQQAVVANAPGARWNAIQAVLARNYPDHMSGARPGATSSAKPPGRDAASPAPAASVPGSNPLNGRGFDIVITNDNWENHVRAYSGRQRLRSFVQQVAGLYDFLGPRDYTARNHWMVDARCPMLRHELRRRGLTGLDLHGRWQSIDTQSFHALRANRWIGCYRREYPMGWGWVPSAAGQAPDSPYVAEPPDNFSSQDFWRWVKQATNWDLIAGTSNPLADSRAVAGRQTWPGSGLPAYFDVDDGSADRPLRFDILLRHPGPDNSIITTRSAAETFFSRPRPRGDGLVEHGNLFHPYWQARLASPGLLPPQARDKAGWP